MTAADPDRLLQVLVNLLQNAVDASRDAGRSSVWLSADRVGPAVEIVVQDEGPGLHPDIEGRLFEPFATTKPPGEGTGLGLYLTKLAAEAHGDQKRVSGEPYVSHPLMVAKILAELGYSQSEISGLREKGVV